jgi:hypothetical protein
VQSKSSRLESPIQYTVVRAGACLAPHTTFFETKMGQRGKKTHDWPEHPNNNNNNDYDCSPETTQYVPGGPGRSRLELWCGRGQADQFPARVVACNGVMHSPNDVRPVCHVRVRASAGVAFQSILCPCGRLWGLCAVRRGRACLAGVWHLPRNPSPPFSGASSSPLPFNSTADRVRGQVYTPLSLCEKESSTYCNISSSTPHRFNILKRGRHPHMPALTALHGVDSCRQMINCGRRKSSGRSSP